MGENKCKRCKGLIKSPFEDYCSDCDEIIEKAKGN